MTYENFVVPDLGEGLAGVEILEWHAAVGDSVVEDQLLVSVDSEKAEVELTSPFSGRVHRLGGDVGDFIEVGNVLVVIETSPT